MIVTVNIDEAQQRREELCDAAVRGESIIIIDTEGSATHLVALTDEEKAAYKAATD